MAGKAESDVNGIAAAVVEALTTHRQIDRFSQRPGGFAIDDAYRVTALLRAAFERRGERIVGRKIGFTNRDMWKVHGVDAPIWGYCTDHTTFELSDPPALRVGDFAEPRIEPEIMFGLGRAPSPDMDEAALLECIDWVAFGYEIVQSIYPGWQFAAADTIAANALHGLLLVGKRHAFAPRREDWRRELARFGVELRCDGTLRATGGGDRVLGSPLIALRQLVHVLEKDRHNPPLRAGEIVSTGTLTLATPVRAGESWLASVRGTPLDTIEIRFEP